MPLLGLLATLLVTGLWTTGFDAFYGLRIVVAGGLLWIYRAHYRGLWLRPSWEAIAIGVAVFAVWIALVPRHDADSSKLMREGLAGLGAPLAAAWIAVRAIGSVVFIPVVEELAFRGYLLRRLIDSNFIEVPYGRFTFVSFAVSSLAFGLMHSAPLAGTLAGMAYAGAQYRKGRLTDAIAAHAVTNGLIAIDVLVNGAWALW
jgi:CAAX prenyl protease-like protein